MSYEDDNLVSDVLRKIAEDHETVFDIKEQAGVRRIEIVRRKALPELRTESLPLARSPARCHVFHDIDTFGEYCERECCENSNVILADAVNQEIVAVLDESSEFGREYIRFKPTMHPLFAPWFKILDRPIQILEFGLFCSRYRRSITKPDGREVALVFQQIKFAKSIEINKGVGAKSINGIMVHSEISGVKNNQVIDLPETIEITMPIFIGGKPEVIPLDILLDWHGDNAVAHVTCPELEVLRVAAFDGFVDRLAEQSEDLLVGLGSVGSIDWKTVPQ